MFKTHLIGSIVVASLSACGSSHKVITPSVVQVESREAPRNEAANVPEDLREAMLVLRRVHFPYASATLQPAARDALTQAAEPLRRYPDVHLYIDGHADVRGTDAYNKDLGTRRAAAVVEGLVRQGIASERLHINSFGSNQVLVDGAGVIAHASNRRVEFRLVRGDVRLVIEEGVLFDDQGQLLGGRTADTE